MFGIFRLMFISFILKNAKDTCINFDHAKINTVEKDNFYNFFYNFLNFEIFSYFILPNFVKNILSCRCFYLSRQSNQIQNSVINKF